MEVFFFRVPRGGIFFARNAKKKPSLARKQEGKSYLEQFSKIRATGGENDAMGFQAFAVAGQRHVHKVLIVPQIFKRRGYAALVIVPSQTEMLCIYHRCVYSPAIRKQTPCCHRLNGGGLRLGSNARKRDARMCN